MFYNSYAVLVQIYDFTIHAISVPDQIRSKPQHPQKKVAGNQTTFLYQFRTGKMCISWMLHIAFQFESIPIIIVIPGMVAAKSSAEIPGARGAVVFQEFISHDIQYGVILPRIAIVTDGAFFNYG